MADENDDQQARDEDARAFIDVDVARAYRQRPPYPEALFAELSRTVAGSRTVLDLGCGTGDICRRLAPYVDRIDAVDVSEPMMAAGRELPGGNSPKITWHCSPAETFACNGPYGLALAGESLHWMQLATVLPKIAAALAEGARFGVISREESAPWGTDFLQIIPGFSAAKAYRPRDLVAEIESAGLGECERRIVFGPEPFSQTVDDYVELQHSRGAFALRRMGAKRSAEFDHALRAILADYAVDGRVTYDFSATARFFRLHR